MSYQVIARKWRPQSFDDVIGQSHVTTPLRNAIRSNRMPHALLLAGPRGVGKTTLARILARCLNCEKGPTDSPCGTCPGCRDIIDGRSTDVQEIDAASRTGVDDIREVIESIRYAPSPGKHRIFVIDEVHMLSKQAFNALLKTLEEPPPRSLFVFATTNPEAIPFTVLSRCQRYDLRRIAAAEVARCLGSIAEAEGIEISKQSLLALAREGDGSMRDSQTLLDQVISYGGSKVTDETVSQVLDLIDRRLLIAIVEACIESNPKAALETCALAADKGTDPKRLGASLIQLFRDLVVLSIAPDSAGELLDGSAEDIEELIALTARSNTARLRRMFRILVSEQEDLAWAPQPFAVLEMAVVRLASLPEAGDIAQLIVRLDALEQKLAGAGDGGTGSTGSGPVQAVAGKSETSRPSGSEIAKSATIAQTEERDEIAKRSLSHSPASTSTTSTSTTSTSTASTSTTSTSTAPTSTASTSTTTTSTRSGSNGGAASSEVEHSTSASTSAENSPEAESMATPEAVLDRLRALARDQKLPLYRSLGEVRLIERNATSLHFAANGEFYAKRLEDRRADLEALCQRFFGKPMKIEISQSEAPSKSRSASAQSDANRELNRERRHAALNHPSVNLVLKQLRGEIIEIRALDGPKSEPA